MWFVRTRDLKRENSVKQESLSPGEFGVAYVQTFGSCHSLGSMGRPSWVPDTLPGRVGTGERQRLVSLSYALRESGVFPVLALEVPLQGGTV